MRFQTKCFAKTANTLAPLQTALFTQLPQREISKSNFSAPLKLTFAFA